MSYETLQEQLNNLYRAARECLRVFRRTQGRFPSRRKTGMYRHELILRGKRELSTKDLEELRRDVTVLCEAQEEITRLLGLDEVKPITKSRGSPSINSLHELLTLASDGVVNVTFRNSHEALGNGIRRILTQTVSKLENYQPRKQGAPVLPMPITTQGLKLFLSDEVCHMLTPDWWLNVVHDLSDFSDAAGILDLEARLEREYIVACDKLRQLNQSPSRAQRHPKKGKGGRTPDPKVQERNKRMAAAFANGDNVNQVCKRFDVSKHVARRVRSDAGKAGKPPAKPRKSRRS